MESSEDRRARTLLKETTKKIGDRYETGLIWKYDQFRLPYSFRLVCLERKLEIDVELANILKTPNF